jgi:chitinase
MLLNGTFILSAYYTSWSIYLRGFEVSSLPVSNLTHLNYAFARVNDSGHVHLTDLWADTQRPVVRQQGLGGLFGNLGALYEYKRENTQLKVGLSVGGWSGSGSFSLIAGGNDSRRVFAETSMELLLQMGLDYIDLDWEYPVSGGQAGQAHSVQDGRNYVLLLREIRAVQFEAMRSGRWRGTQPPGLTLALPCGQLIGRFDYMEEMGDLVDFANMMCYDFTGPWSKVADHHANLFSRTAGDESVDSGIRELLAAGFPARKIVLGVPIYGRGFDNCTGGLGAPFSSATVGTWGDAGVLDYKALNLRNSSCLPRLEPETYGTFCQDRENNRLVSYDSVTAVRRKVQYVQEMGLAGVMFWEASADIFTDPRDGLIAAAKAALPALDRLANNLCYPSSKYSNINSAANCTIKGGVPVGNGELLLRPLAPVNMKSIGKAVPFGSRIHQQIDKACAIKINTE